MKYKIEKETKGETEIVKILMVEEKKTEVKFKKGKNINSLTE